MAKTAPKFAQITVSTSRGYTHLYGLCLEGLVWEYCEMGWPEISGWTPLPNQQLPSQEEQDEFHQKRRGK